MRPIIDRKLWDRVQADHSRKSSQTRLRVAGPRPLPCLKGLIFDSAGIAMSPTHTRRKGRLYRYYISQRPDQRRASRPGPNSLRVPAGEIEEIVIAQLRRMIASPEIIAATWRQRGTPAQLTENEIRALLASFDGVWTELFPAEQQRITSLLVDRVVVFPTKVDVHLLEAGFASLVTEIE